MKNKRFLALVLSVLMVITSSVVIFAADNGKTESASVGLTEAMNALRESVVGNDYYKPDEKVNVIIVLEGESLVDLAGEDVAEYAASAKGQKAAEKLVKKHDKLRAELAERYDISFEGSLDYVAITNAITAKITYKDLAKIASYKGVKTAYVAGTYDAPKAEVKASDFIGVNEMISAGAVNGTTYTGKGIKVAIIDSGLVYDHEAFSVMPEGVKTSVSGMKRLIRLYDDVLNSGADGAVISDKIIFAYDYADGDSDVYPTDDHGTHVAGIVAGNNGKNFAGVAPNAQIMAMKVFGDDAEGAYTDDILAALEDAVILGADVVNMSLGSPAGFTYEAVEYINEAYDAAEAAGVVLCVSAGNAYHQGVVSSADDLPYAELPDYGVVGSPSTYNAALSVASADNDYAFFHYIEAGDLKIPFTEYLESYYTGEAPDVSVAELYDTELEYVYCGLGSPEEIVDVKGKVALIDRGDLTFQEKVDNAAAAGAVAVVLANTDDEAIFFMLAPASIPVAVVTKTNGTHLKNLEEKVLTFSSDLDAFTSLYAGTMSGFSSWGCAPDLTLKPEITAPGGDIYSTSFDDTYVLMSGTSMSCPVMAGASAVMLEYLYRYDPKLDKCEARDAVLNRFMSTADPLVNAATGTYYSPRKQGAGMIDIVDAISTRSYLTVNGGRPKASAGSSTKGVFTYTFEVNNPTNKNELYALDTTVLTDRPASDGYYLYSALMSMELIEGEDYTISYSAANGKVSYRSFNRNYIEKEDLGIKAEPTSSEGICVAVAANSKATVTVTVKLTKDIKDILDMYFANGIYIEGYTTATPTNGTELSVPFLGFYGDWASLPIFDLGDAYNNYYYYYPSSMAVAYMSDGSSYYAPLGYNVLTGEYDAEKIAYGAVYYDYAEAAFLSSDIGYLRNAKDVYYTITDEEGNVVLEYGDPYGQARKYSFFGSSHTDDSGLYEWSDTSVLEEGKYTYTITGTSGGGLEQSISYDFTVDKTAPAIVSAEYEEDVYTFGATDETALQGVQLFVTATAGEETGIIGTVEELIDVTVQLYELGYITYDAAIAVLMASPYAEFSASEDGEILYTTYDLSGYAEFIELCNEVVMPMLYGDTLTLNLDTVAFAALDYAYNISEYGAIVLE